MNVVAEIQRINAAELENGSVGTSASWHGKYADSAWCYIGNLPLQLTEGDVICIFSQFGEVEDINLVREETTGKSRGFAFIKYEDARSCVLAVDNFAGSKILERSIRVDHVEKYRLPKELLEKEESAPIRADPGHAYDGKELANDYSISQGRDLFAPLQRARNEPERMDDHAISKQELKEAKRKRKEAREEKRREKEERRRRREESQRVKRAKRMSKEKGREEHGKKRRARKKGTQEAT